VDKAPMALVVKLLQVRVVTGQMADKVVHHRAADQARAAGAWAAVAA